MNDNGFRISRSDFIFWIGITFYGIYRMVYLLKYSSMKYIFEELVDYLYKNMGSFSMYYEANGIKTIFEEI